MNRTTPKSIGLLVAGLLTAGLVPLVYARTRTPPRSWTEEQRERNRLSALLGDGRRTAA